MSLGPTLETERLILRPPIADDLPRWIEFQEDAEAMRYLGGPSGPEMTWRSVCAVAGSWTIEGFGFFSVIEKATGLWVGRLGPWRPLGWPGAEVGWSLTPQSWGKGYATEGATRAIDWVFDVLDWEDVIHCIDPDNQPSQAVAQRLGSRNRGPGRLPLPIPDHPIDIWGQTRAEWRARPR